MPLFKHMQKNNINLSLNGIAGTLWEIRRQEKIHPYLGLRQAALIIDSQEKALRAGRLELKRNLLKLKKQKEQVLKLIDDELDILQDEIYNAECEIDSCRNLIRDAEVELNVAVEEKRRIEFCYPDMENETYESLQEKYANEAFVCKLARAVVISAYSAHKGLSEGAAEIIYDSECLSPGDQAILEMNMVGKLRQLAPELFKNPPNNSLVATNGNTNGNSIN